MVVSGPTVVIRQIFERDIDLLLLEELVASASFRRWFLESVGIDSDAELQRAERSVLGDNGESDLELTLLAAGKTVKLLIENKVYAPLQPAQAERYGERALTYRKDGTCDQFVTVVIAPEVYFGFEAKHGFDVFIPYEAVLGWFESATELGQRKTYKLAAMRKAIEFGTAGWQMVPNAAATQFWQSYWELSEQTAPVLRMPKPDAKPATSNFIRFRPLGLPADVKLLHKLYYGRVDLQFSGMGEKLKLIQNRFGKFMSPKMRVEQAQKSAAIRICVPKIDLGLPFDESKREVQEALSAALSLLQMFEAARKK